MAPATLPFRNRKPTTRKQQLEDEAQAKEAAKAASSKKSLLRAKQSLAEANDYEDERFFESEDESDNGALPSFRTITIEKTPRAQIQAKPKPVLVRRVGSGKENQSTIVTAPLTVDRISNIASVPPVQWKSPRALQTVQSRAPRLSPLPPCLSSDGEQADTQDEPSPSLPAATPRQPNHPKTVLGPRKASSTPSAATTVVIKKKKNETGTRGRIKASQFDSLTKTILEDACGYYRCLIASEFPYPSPAEDQEWAGKAWVTACKARGVEIEFDEDILKLITTRAAQVRGELKTKARAIVERLYDLDEISDEDNKRNVRNRVETLLHRSNFIFRDPNKRTGIYRSAVITKIINKMWFAHHKDEGIIYHSFFYPRISLVTIALVLTAVENVLDEWQTGERTDVHFSASLYRAKFEKQLANLEKFATHTKRAGIVPSMQKELARLARLNAKVPAETVSVDVLDLDDADFKTAMEEWDACASGAGDVDQDNSVEPD